MAQQAFEELVEDNLLETLSPNRALSLTLLLDDPEVVAELRRRRGRDRERFAAEALKVGVLALRAAGGQIDASAVREAGSAVVSEIHQLMNEQTGELAYKLTSALTAYFDPATGTLPQRLDALVKRDGELERVLREQIGHDNSVLSTTLSKHIGEGSELFKLLSPTDADGLKAQIESTVKAELAEQRENVLREFSLDHEESALRRLVEELTDHHGTLREDLSGQIDDLVKEFSLDHPDSAINRLVKQVEGAHQKIDAHLTLDDESSPLARLKREITTTLADLVERQNQFQSEVRETLAAQQARRKEENRSTRHGDTFELELGGLLARMAQRYGDVYEATGGKAGVIRNNKKGDYVIQLGAEASAAGERVVWEAKEDKKWDLARALAYLEEARKNRNAQLGVFVFSRKSAPEGLETFARYGQSLVIVWDADDPATDVLVQCAYSVTRAVAAKSRQDSDEEAEALSEIHRATRNIERQARYLDDFRKSGEGIIKSAEKIVDRARRMSKELEKEVSRLDDQLDHLRLE